MSVDETVELQSENGAEAALPKAAGGGPQQQKLLAAGGGFVRFRQASLRRVA